jgi:sugar O-acyltransferase (sialic acid O-acetyltransferase NeuD family)
MKDIVIVGAGGFGREVKTIIDAINANGKTYNFLGFYDDTIAKGTLINNFPILGNLSELNALTRTVDVLLGIGDPSSKSKIINSLTNELLHFPTIIHPSVIISEDDVAINNGCIICAGTIITCNIKIGKFVTLNLMCTVGHDTIIGDYSSFMPSVNISGEVHIEEKVYVGTGAKIINRLAIGNNTIVGAGAVVSKSLPEKCTAVGIPAKPIKFHTNE